MKALIVTPGLSGGGAERVATNIANALSAYGHEVAVAPVYDDKHEYRLTEEARISACLSTRKGIRGTLDRSVKLKKLLSAEHPDVTLSFVITDMAFSELTAAPVVQTLRNDPWNEGTNKAHKVLRDFAFQRASAVVFQTGKSMEYFPDSIRAKGIVLPNPLEVASLPRWSGDATKREFIAAGRLEPQKNYPMLFRAFACFSATHPDHVLSVYGEGSQRKELESLIRDLGMDGRIVLKGRTNQVHECMAAASCFVMSSDYEGVSNSMLEALCIGMPCVVTDHSPGGAREYITDGENGLLTKVGDFEDMARAMARIADEPGLAERLGAKAALTRGRVDSETVCRQWERMLLDVAANGHL